MVTSAAVDRNNYGEASDHLPINAVLQMWSLKAKARSYLLWFVFSHHQLKYDLSSPVNSVLLQFFLFFPQLVKCPPAVTPITDALHQNDCFYVSNVRNSTVTLSLIYWSVYLGFRNWIENTFFYLNQSTLWHLFIPREVKGDKHQTQPENEV